MSFVLAGASVLVVSEVGDASIVGIEVSVGEATNVSVGGSGAGVGFGANNPQASVARDRLSPAHNKGLRFFFITVLQ